MNNRSTLPRKIVFTITALLLLVAAYAYYKINEQLRCEYETARVVRMVSDYVKSHDRKWPTSWDDLDATETARESELDSSYYKQYTVVDFTLTADQLLDNPSLIYTAIMPVSGKYTTYHKSKTDLDALMDTLRATDDIELEKEAKPE